MNTSSSQYFKSSKNDYDDEDDQEAIKQEYQSLALQLLDLMHTLHTRASQIYKTTNHDQTTSSLLWYKCWCPILQGKSNERRKKEANFSKMMYDVLFDKVLHDFVVIHVVQYVQRHWVIFNEVFFYLNYIFSLLPNGNRYLIKFYFHCC